LAEYCIGRCPKTPILNKIGLFGEAPKTLAVVIIGFPSKVVGVVILVKHIDKSPLNTVKDSILCFFSLV
jgi:hypothetical protein